ncbi:MAG: valyl-tRNA synthetase, partial [Acidimicrobiaceae bacterium]
SGSIHRAAWPTTAETVAGIDVAPDSVEALDAICGVLGAVRRTKTEAKVSKRAEVAKLVVTADENSANRIKCLD